MEGVGIAALALRFLSSKEKTQIVELAKKDAIARRDAGERPEARRADLHKRLSGYSSVEIKQAIEILEESDSEALTLDDVRRVWDRVSVALDHHSGDEKEVADLQVLEIMLAEAGRYGPAERQS